MKNNFMKKEIKKNIFQPKYFHTFIYLLLINIDICLFTFCLLFFIDDLIYCDEKLRKYDRSLQQENHFMYKNASD